VLEAADGLVAGAGLDAGDGLEAGAGLDAGAGLEAGAGLDAGAGLEAGAGLDAVAVLEAVAGSGAGVGPDEGGGSEAGGGVGSDASGGPDAAPAGGIASKRFENFIPCLVPAPRDSCFSPFVAGERRSPVCCQEPAVRARRWMSVCTALVTPWTGLLAVVLPCPEESVPTSACAAAALLESAWATAIAAQAPPINRQPATMQTPAAKRNRATITIRPHQNRYQPNLCHIVPYSIGYAACKVVHARDGRQHLEAQLTRSGSTTLAGPTGPKPVGERQLEAWWVGRPAEIAAMHARGWLARRPR